MSYRYESIIGTGRIEFVEDALEKVHALEKIVLHQCGRRVKVDAAPEGVTVLLLRAESLECKRNARQGGLL